MKPGARSPRERAVQFGVVMFILILVAIVVKALEGAGSRRTVRRPAGPSASEPDPYENPLINQLTPAPDRVLEKGVAVAVLVDVSGSMRERVAGADGKRSAKIDIAKRCALDLVEHANVYARANADRKILLGIYEFSGRDLQPALREVVGQTRPDPVFAAPRIRAMSPEGGTPIGDAILAAKRRLDATGLDRLHLLVVTDGVNTQGYDPVDVVSAMGRLAPEARPAVYFVAFDIAADTFKGVRNAGGLVLSAANETELNETLAYILTGKILAEMPDTGE